MKEQYDRDILQSIRSDDSNQSEQRIEQKKNATQPKKPFPSLLDDQDQEQQHQIRDSVNFGDDSFYSNQKVSKQNKLQSSQEKSGDFSMFNQTDQIRYGQKFVEPKHEIHYPEIKITEHKKSPKKMENETKYKIPEHVNINLLLNDEEQQIDINMSMIGARPKAFKEKHIEKQELQQETKHLKKEKEPVNPFQSIYLPNKNKVEEKTGIYLKVMDDTMYWVFQDKEIKITSEILESLVEHFFKKQIMLPLINDTQFKSEHISVFMQVYTQFLNEFFPQIFKQIFVVLKAHTASKFQTGSNPLTPKSGKGLMKNLYENYLPNFFKSSGYSKAELIRNHMMKKLSLISYLQNMQKQKPQQNRDLVLQQKRQQTQYSIAILELLVSFQSSENYCRNYSKQGIDHRIWKEHGRKISELRKRWIDKIESIKKDFSFKI